MNRFIRESLPSRIVFGGNRLESELYGEIRLLGSVAPLLISNASTDLNQLVTSLHPGWAGQWTDVRQHVPTELADRCHQRAADLKADLLVAVGGGSATGLAKAVAYRSGLRILCVPTTYAGSEMTPIWGQTDALKKTTARDNKVLPATVIYDPLLLVPLPGPVVAASGMNALAHCVEALYAPKADPLSTLMAVDAAGLLFDHLRAAAQAAQGSARGEILWASCLAGSVLGTVGGSLHHSICHILGGLHELPHAETHAAVLPQALAYLLDAVSLRLRPLAARLGAVVNELPGMIWDLGASVGTPAGLSEIGITEGDLPGIVTALLDANPAAPVPLTLEDATELVDRLFHGDRPTASRPVAAAGADRRGRAT
ncbi:iron-containing alcohol dehydrogenase [[Mycobacterium] wendilense]|uniref:Iron-containing alcohol dehydrogenase n=1 Tax=[Mycobacterium] wendilense TaxID=3064284 RepID=A0ABM9MA10_9MYCO|nr:iron-containing alcohol dehydrogenase [Mycolicibacterium sp. MU0050]CAJ1580058.1 iron-containing alcohol dehydrogenase [Mycolicibacterium sp. MU0050]